MCTLKWGGGWGAGWCCGGWVPVVGVTLLPCPCPLPSTCACACQSGVPFLHYACTYTAVATGMGEQLKRVVDLSAGRSVLGQLLLSVNATLQVLCG
jgi:hypothetical protein